MKTLAFDTSSSSLSLALVEGEHLLGEVTLNLGKNHSTILMPAIDFLCQQLGLVPQDIARLVVAKGPGSYTGLRIAATTAKTLAYSLDKPLFAVSSLAVIARSCQIQDVLMVPVIDARRGNVYAGAYLNGEVIIQDQHLALRDMLTQALETGHPVVLCGEVGAFESVFADYPTIQVLSDTYLQLPKAYYLAQLAGEQTQVTDVHGFVPSYLKQVEAEEKWQATHQEGGQGDYIQKL